MTEYKKNIGLIKTKEIKSFSKSK